MIFFCRQGRLLYVKCFVTDNLIGCNVRLLVSNEMALWEIVFTKRPSAKGTQVLNLRLSFYFEFC